MSATILPLRGPAHADTAAALARLEAHLDRCALAANTVTAYRRQARAYLAWLAEPAHAAEQADAFLDHIGAEAAVAAWRRSLLEHGASPATVNQALAAVKLLYEHGASMRIKTKTARVPPPGAPKALSRTQENALRRAADRRGTRDAAIIALLLGTGARAEECARLKVHDVPITERTGVARLLGKGDQVRTVPIAAPARERVSAWLLKRTELLAAKPHLAERAGDALWIGKRGPLTVDGITDVVLAAGQAAPKDTGLAGTRPHELRHTYATRLRHDGADLEQIRKLLGHDSLDTTRRYFLASDEEIAALVDRALDY